MMAEIEAPALSDSHDIDRGASRRRDVTAAQTGRGARTVGPRAPENEIFFRYLWIRCDVDGAA